MDKDSCAFFGKCIDPFHDHDEREHLPLAELVDTEDPAFEAIARILLDMRAAGIELTEDTVGTAVKLGRHYHQRAEAPLPMPTRRISDLVKPVVYYIRIGNQIKIGTTQNMHTRMADLKPDEILAVEPGSYDVERERHRQFARHRVHGEYFLPARELTDHIRQVRARYGRPPKKKPNLRRSRTVLVQGPEPLFS